MLRQIRPVVTLLVIFTLVTGVAFPLAFTAAGSLALPFQSGGSLVERDGKIIGSALLGQDFEAAKYFHGRPSALMGADPKDSSKQIPTPYDAGESGASNLAPTSKALLDRVTADLAHAGAKPVPADAVTTSASGLDPDISPANAANQVARVAAARGLGVAAVAALVAEHTEGRLLGIIGEPHVRVLELNLALDQKPAVNLANANR
jgi:K+-transporting ATPase ATPase C chain